MLVKPMCPQTETFLGERPDAMPQASYQHTMVPSSLLSVCSNDMRVSSVNLPCINLSEICNMSSVEHAFSQMKIDIGRQTCYTSNPATRVSTSEQVDSGSTCYHHISIDTYSDVNCVDDEDTLQNNPAYDDVTEHDPESDTFRHITQRLFEGDNDGDNRLHLSIINGLTDFSHLIINLAPEYDCLSFCNHLRQTPMHLAVLTRQPDIVRRLICAGATVLAQDKQGDTPLHIACRLGNAETVKHLLTPVKYEETLENKYSIPYQRVPQDLDIRNYDGRTCLHIAAGARNFEVMRMLLKAGANINGVDGCSGRSVLHLAADTGDTEMVEMLLSCRGINVEGQDYAGLTPAELAYGRGHMQIVKMICTISGQYHEHVSQITLE